MKIRDVRAITYKALSIIVVFSLLVGVFSVFPTGASPVLTASAAGEKENIYTEETDPYVVFDAEYMKGDNRLTGASQCSYSFVTDWDGRTLLRLVTEAPGLKDDGTPKPEDPYISFEVGGAYSADEYKYVTILARGESEFINKSNFRIFYKLNATDKKTYDGSRNAATMYVDTDEWQLISFDMSGDALWSGGNITGIRFDFYEGSTDVMANKHCDIAAVIISKTPQDMYSVTLDMMQGIHSAEQRLTDFTSSELQFFDRAEGNAPNDTPWLSSLDTVLSTKNGNVVYTFKYNDSVAHSGPDPYAGFFYKELMAARGAEDEILTTSDFRYTVIRYRTAGDVGDPRMQLYLFANGNKGPTFIDGKEIAPSVRYTPSTNNDWKTLVVDMASGNAADGWKGDFDGFRVDWCSPSSVDAEASMEVSDIFFFKNADDAYAFSSALNQIKLPLSIEAEGEDVVDNYVNPIALSGDTLLMLPDQLAGKLIASDNTDYSVADDGGVKVIKLETTRTIDSPYITLDVDGIDTDKYRYITMAVRKNVPSAAALTLKYTTDAAENNVGAYRYRYDETDQWQLVVLDMKDESAWSGNLDKLELCYLTDDPVYTGYAEKTTFEIAGIAFSNDVESFYDSAYYLMVQALRPAQVLTGFTDADLPAFTDGRNSNKSLSSTQVTVQNGNLLYSAVGDFKDPFASFNYKDFMSARGDTNLITTANFTTTVIRYRTSDGINNNIPSGGRNALELFIFTGTNMGPFKVNDKMFTVSKAYSANYYDSWSAMALVMNGISTTAEAWSGDFNGFRLDWANTVVNGDYMEISEFFFFKSTEVADRFTEQVNKLYEPTYNEYDSSYMTEISAPDGTLILSPQQMLDAVSSTNNSKASLVTDGHLSTLKLEATVRCTDPSVTIKPQGIDAGEYKYLAFAIRTENAYAPYMMLNYTTDKSAKLDRQSAAAEYAAGTNWQIVTINLSKKESWQGIVDELKLSYLYTGFALEAGEGVEISALAFCKSEDAVFDAASYMLMQIYRPTQVLGDFTEDDLKCFGKAEVSGGTALSTSADGNIIYSIASENTDPQKHFDYMGYATSKGLKALTTDAFRYTVLRYKSSNIGSAHMELYNLTGDAKSLFDMCSILEYKGDGSVSKFECRHRGSASYNGNASSWKSLVIDMAVGDGYSTSTNLKNGWYRDDGNTKFSGFRFDWCGSGVGAVGSYLMISDFLFFANAEDANNYSTAINAVHISFADTDPEPDPNETVTTESETIPGFVDTDNGENQETLPEFNETDDGGEETLPPFDETYPPFIDETDEIVDTDEETPSEDVEIVETTEVETDPEIETDEIDETEIESEDESETDGESDSETETETEKKPQGGGNNGGFVEDIGGIGGGNENEKTEEQGSQMPFYIACGALAALSLASVVTIIVIKIKTRA